MGRKGLSFPSKSASNPEVVRCLHNSRWARAIDRLLGREQPALGPRRRKLTKLNETDRPRDPGRLLGEGEAEASEKPACALALSFRFKVRKITIITCRLRLAPPRKKKPYQKGGVLIAWKAREMCTF